MTKVTVHELSWQESLIICCEWSSRGKCGPASYVLIRSLHHLADLPWNHQILFLSLASKSNRERSRFKLISGATDTEVLAKGGTWDITGCRSSRSPLRRYCKLWHIRLMAFFPYLGVTSKETSKQWESQGEKNGYSPGALVGGIRM